MTPVIFINCREDLFIDKILDGRKWYETRTSNTLGQFFGRRVYLAETGHGKPIVKCSAVIHTPIEVTSKKEWENSYRDLACITEGSKYDWKQDTKIKYCYYLDEVKPVFPFIPEGKRHGRVWMEYEEDA